MINERKDYQPVAAKLELRDFHRLTATCKLNKVKLSEFIREAILSKLNEGAISNIAGNNEITYNPEKDTFVWKVRLDNIEEAEIMSGISVEFVEDLSEQLKFQLKKREELLGKKNKNSIAIPKRLLK